MLSEVHVQGTQTRATQTRVTRLEHKAYTMNVTCHVVQFPVCVLSNGSWLQLPGHMSIVVLHHQPTSVPPENLQALDEATRMKLA